MSMNDNGTIGEISVLTPSQKKALEQKSRKAAEMERKAREAARKAKEKAAESARKAKEKAAEAARKAEEASLAAREKAAEAARQAIEKKLLEEQRAKQWLKIKKACLWIVGFTLTGLLLWVAYIISKFLIGLTDDGIIFVFVATVWLCAPVPIFFIWMFISSILDDLNKK